MSFRESQTLARLWGHRTLTKARALLEPHLGMRNSVEGRRYFREQDALYTLDNMRELAGLARVVKSAMQLIPPGEKSAVYSANKWLSTNAGTFVNSANTITRVVALREVLPRFMLGELSSKQAISELKKKAGEAITVTSLQKLGPNTVSYTYISPWGHVEKATFSMADPSLDTKTDNAYQTMLNYLANGFHQPKSR